MNIHRVNESTMQAKVNMMWELQSASEEELSALLPSVLRPQGGAFKGEL